MTIASYIEHTNLKPDAVPADILQLCDEAKTNRFAAVCVNSGYVSLAKKELQGSGVLISAVVAFPLGAAMTAAKAAETDFAVSAGADEIDMDMSIGRAKAGDWDYVRRDVEAVVAAAGSHPVKVILETGLLTDEEKKEACRVAVTAGAAYVKTSTGFGHGGATAADIRLLRAVVGTAAKIKAAGGIRDYAAAKAMLDSGADRIGTSAGIAIAGGERDE